MNREQELLAALVCDRSVMQIDEPAGVSADCCRYCGCTEDNACLLEADGRKVPHHLRFSITRAQVHPCAWYRQPNHHGLGVCSNPECVKSYLADPGAP